MSWIKAWVWCSRCAHQWVAVYPERTDELVCPRCGYLDPVLPEEQDDAA